MDASTRTRTAAAGDAPMTADAVVRSSIAVLPAERRRQSIAIEPMTCPPHAFRSGTDVVTLAPGRSWSGTWGLTAG